MNKNKYVIIILLILTCLMFNITESKIYGNEKYTNILNELLTERTIIMNRGLYEEDTNINSIKEELEKIEGDKLLNKDLDIIEYIRNNPTDYPYITKVKIEDTKLIDNNKNYMKFKVNVKWTFNSIDNEVSDNNKLFINITKEEGQYLMTNIDFINE